MIDARKTSKTLSRRNFFTNSRKLGKVAGDVSEAVARKRLMLTMDEITKLGDRSQTERLSRKSRNAGEMDALRRQDNREWAEKRGKYERNDYIKNKNRDRDRDLSRDTAKDRKDISAAYRRAISRKGLIGRVKDLLGK